MSVYIGEEERENIEMDEGGNVVQKGEDVGPDKLSFPSMENEIEENYQGDAYSQGSKRRALEAEVNDDLKAYAEKKREKTSPVWAQFEQLSSDESTGNRSAECKIYRTIISQVNLLVQVGIGVFEKIVDVVRDGVKYVAGSKGRQLKFVEIAKV
ncbi:hypothetical protein Droror1_Dr00023286 [Drosera rotundifolia]